MAKLRLVFDLADSQQALIDALQPVQTNSLRYLARYIEGIRNGAYQQTNGMTGSIGAVSGTQTVTFSSTGPVNNETMTIGATTITAKTSSTANNEFTRSNTPSVDATNLAACINASTTLVGIVTATAAAGVVTVTAVVPGLVGNQIAITESMTNTVVGGATLTGGLEGTTFNCPL